jgi:tetratricopeptide (TPR) repeat protein
MLTREGGHVLANTLPTNFVQNLLVEVAVPQPPELVGTSFAAPFGTGFGALVQDRASLPYMASLPFAMTPLFTLLQKLDEGASTDSVAETLRDGFFVFAEAVPEAHRHWTVAKPAPCPTCSLFMTNWYLNLVALLIGMGRADEAIKWGALAAALVPHSAEVAANLGTAFERTSSAWLEDSSQRERLLQQASDQFRKALRLEPGNPTWRTRLAEVSRQSAANTRRAQQRHRR